MMGKAKLTQADIPVGSVVTFTVTGKVVSSAQNSINPELGAYVNVRSDKGETYRLAYLDEIVYVELPIPEPPESDRVLFCGEVMSRNMDGVSWESKSFHFTDWNDLVDYARRNVFGIYEINIGDNMLLNVKSGALVK